MVPNGREPRGYGVPASLSSFIDSRVQRAREQIILTNNISITIISNGTTRGA